MRRGKQGKRAYGQQERVGIALMQTSVGDSKAYDDQRAMSPIGLRCDSAQISSAHRASEPVPIPAAWRYPRAGSVARAATMMTTTRTTFPACKVGRATLLRPPPFVLHPTDPRAGCWSFPSAFLPHAFLHGYCKSCSPVNLVYSCSSCAPPGRWRPSKRDPPPRQPRRLLHPRMARGDVRGRWQPIRVYGRAE